MQSTAEANIAVVRDFLAAALAGEPRADLVTDDFTWHFAGRSKIAGDYRGLDEFRSFIARITAVTSAPAIHELELHDIVANEQHVVVLWRRRGRRAEVELDSNGVGVYHVTNGRVSEAWVVHEDQHQADAYFGTQR